MQNPPQPLASPVPLLPPHEFHLRPVPGPAAPPLSTRPAQDPPPPAPIRLPAAPFAFAHPTARAAVILEPIVSRDRQLRLFASFSESAVPWVNGAPPPCHLVLAPGDQVTWDTGETFEVAVFHRPHLGAPPPSLLGRPCPICRVPLAPDVRCLVCACGAGLHAELDAVNGLQCASLGPACPVCRRPLVLSEGYQPSPAHDA